MTTIRKYCRNTDFFKARTTVKYDASERFIFKGLQVQAKVLLNILFLININMYFKQNSFWINIVEKKLKI